MTISVSVQLTTRCNLNCIHCFVDGSGDDISVGIIEKIIPFAKACKCSCLDFTGGEPTLHPGFFDIIRLLANNDLQFTMVTNGWRFAEDYRNINPYVDSIRKLIFSLDGATEDIHDSIRAEGSYRRVMQAVSICRFKEIPFGIRTVVSRSNIHQLEGIALVAAKIGAEYLTLIPLQPTPRTVAQNLILHPDDLKEIKQEALRLRKIFAMKILLTAGYLDEDPLALCPALTMNELFLTSKEEVGFCCQLADYERGTKDSDILGSLEEMTLHDAQKRVIDAVAAYKKDKIQRLADGKLGKMDYYSCWYCLKYFKKVDWMAEFSDNPWSEDVLTARTGKSARELAMAQEHMAG